MKKWIAWICAVFMVLGASLAQAEQVDEINWDMRYRYEELEEQLKQIAAAYPQIAQLYPIGTSFQERTLWCMELTNTQAPAEEKTGIAVMANIHGGERESASCAMYFAW